MELRFPFAEPPAPGEVKTVADGILWFRLPLPYRLDHVNIYFIDDGRGWALVDTGLGNKATLAAWQALLDSVLSDRPLTRDMILNSVWGYESFPNTRTVDAHVVRLRQKLERDASCPHHFLTVHGVGYRFLP